MRIMTAKIRGYRCLDDLTLDFADYTAFIGPNGSGKSAVLYALNWFFNGGEVDDHDLHVSSGSPTTTEVSVEVTFGDLNIEDRRILGKYGRGSVAVLRRSWFLETGKEKMIGNAMQGPGFAEVRATSSVVAMRSAYTSLKSTCTSLRDVPMMASKDQIVAELDHWEDDPSNREQLVEVDDDDATHMFGIAGEYTLAKRMRMVLVPAAADIADQVGSAGGSSALAYLVGNLMKEAVATAKSAWETEFADRIRELEVRIEASVASATSLQAARVNERLQSLVPNTIIEFSAEAPTWNLRGDPTLNTNVVIDGVRNDVSRQGHGIQRAIMIAMLQALVPDETLTVNQHTLAEGETEDDAAERLRVQLQALPALVVAIEEPEIYQHPVRARSFARVLSALSGRPDTQVFIATHSPYFVLPEQFSSLRCFRLASGRSSIAFTSVPKVAALAGCAEIRVTTVVERELPRTFSEGFFAETVVFVEGDTDRVVLEAIAERLGTPFDSAGVAILAMGSKENLEIPYRILAALNVATYVVADCDKLGAARKHPNDASASAQVDASHKNSTELLLGWLPSAATVTGTGSLPFAYGDPTLVTSHYTLWNDDIETELAQWPSFMASLKSNGGALRSKNVANYRLASMSADVADLPETFTDLVAAVIRFVHL
jgi:energy-coupling factor transporter ATP-binding protein EcfA2